MVTTFLATLFLPIAAAVGIGVALSLLLQLNREALDLTVVELVPRCRTGASRSGRHRRRWWAARSSLLDVYGSLYYAGARTLAARLPDPQGATAPVVVLRLRGRTALGVTSFKILTVYARQLEEAGGRLFLSGVTPDLLTQFRRAEAAESSAIAVFPEAELVGESSAEAYAAALEWRAQHAGDRAAHGGKEET